MWQNGAHCVGFNEHSRAGVVLFNTEWRFMLCFARAGAWKKTLLGVFLLFAGSLALGNVPQGHDWTKEKVPARAENVLGGSFMSVDPVLTDNNTGASFNRYVYANNSPYKYIDPDGRDPDEVKQNGSRGIRGGAGAPEVLKDVMNKEASGRLSDVDGVRSYRVAITRATGEPNYSESTVPAAAASKSLLPEVKTVADIAKGGSALIQTSPKNLISQQTKNEMSGSQVKRLTKDMKVNGFDQSKPISGVVNGNGRIVISDGHHRTESAIKAGIEKVPVEVYKP